MIPSDNAPEAAPAEAAPAEAAPPGSEPSAPSPPPLAARSAWLSPDQALDFGRAFVAWLSRPRVRLALIGSILLLIGAVFMTTSVWTLPLVVVGALMVAIAWIGRRLNGRFAVEWGETGTQLEFRAKIASPQPPRSVEVGTVPNSHKLAGVAEPESGGGGIIDGEAHTVEIEVSELEALIAAVETTKGQMRENNVSAQAAPKFEVARGGAASSDAP